MKETWKGFMERVAMIEKLEAEKYKHLEVKYADKETGEILEEMPQEHSPFRLNRGFCNSCGNKIIEAVADDRFCNGCYKSLFPGKEEEEEEENES